MGDDRSERDQVSKNLKTLLVLVAIALLIFFGTIARYWIHD
jgi:hypothetical protein